jgi:hypothetical protein
MGHDFIHNKACLWGYDEARNGNCDFNEEGECSRDDEHELTGVKMGASMSD